MLNTYFYEMLLTTLVVDSVILQSVYYKSGNENKISQTSPLPTFYIPYFLLRHKILQTLSQETTKRFEAGHNLNRFVSDAHNRTSPDAHNRIISRVTGVCIDLDKHFFLKGLTNEVDVLCMVVVDNPCLQQCIIIIVSTIYIFPL